MAKEGEPKPTKARFALAANVRHLMDAYSKGFEVGLTPAELEKGCGVSHKTIKRIIDPYSDTGPSLDSIDRIAAFFRVEPWELLRTRPPMLHSNGAEVTAPIKPSKAKP
jgi:transcriptional regulator with XRE-family HTH domain